MTYVATDLGGPAANPLIRDNTRTIERTPVTSADTAVAPDLEMSASPTLARINARTKGVNRNALVTGGVALVAVVAAGSAAFLLTPSKAPPQAGKAPVRSTRSTVTPSPEQAGVTSPTASTVAQTSAKTAPAKVSVARVATAAPATTHSVKAHPAAHAAARAAQAPEDSASTPATDPTPASISPAPAAVTPPAPVASAPVDASAVAAPSSAAPTSEPTPAPTPDAGGQTAPPSGD